MKWAMYKKMAMLLAGASILGGVGYIASEELPRQVVHAQETRVVSYSITLVDQDEKVMQTMQKTAPAGPNKLLVPQVDGYRYMGITTPQGGYQSAGSVQPNQSVEMDIVVQEGATYKLHYVKIPPINEIISPQRRAEYQASYDAFHKTILAAYDVYKKELKVNGITYDFDRMSEELRRIHAELVLVQDLLQTPVGTPLSDNHFIYALAWADEYWQHMIDARNKSTQELKAVMATIAASKTTTIPSSSTTRPSSSSSKPSNVTQSPKTSTRPSTTPSSSSKVNTRPSTSTKPSSQPKTDADRLPVYRLYHSGLQVHLYTTDANENKVLAQRGWQREGVAWIGRKNTGQPIYRLYHPGIKVHLYTKDANEYAVLGSRGWKKEGIAYRSNGKKPVYRLYHAGIKKHLYTKDSNEKSILSNRGWKYEGVAWYVE